MENPEALMMVSTYGSIAIPMSKAAEILPHLLVVRTKYKDGDTTPYLKDDDPIEMRYISQEKVIAMLVAAKLNNKE